MGCVQMRQRPGRYLGQPDRPAEADEPAECGRGLPAARGCERGGSAWMWDAVCFPHLVADTVRPSAQFSYPTR